MRFAPGRGAAPPTGSARLGPVPGFRVGLIGYGLAGSVFHGPLLAATPGLEVTTIVTADPDRAGARRAATFLGPRGPEPRRSVGPRRCA